MYASPPTLVNSTAKLRENGYATNPITTRNKFRMKKTNNTTSKNKIKHINKALSFFPITPVGN